MIKPFFLKANGKTIYKGTRSQCIKKLARANGKELKIVKNPRFKWLKRE